MGEKDEAKNMGEKDEAKNVETSSQGSSSGIGEGYAQAGASTFNTAVSWLTYGQERERMAKWRAEDLALAEKQQGIDLRQQGFENTLATQGANLQKEAFDFGKLRWGQEFGFTQRQYQDQLAMQKKQQKMQGEKFDMSKRREALDRIVGTMNRAVGNDVEMKRLVTSRLSGGR